MSTCDCCHKEKVMICHDCYKVEYLKPLEEQIKTLESSRDNSAIAYQLLEKELEEAKKENSLLWEALKKYGKHIWFPCADHMGDTSAKCECGLEQILSQYHDKRSVN